MLMSKLKLIYTWKSGTVMYRVIGSGSCTRGYRDNIILERADTDALGGTRWVELSKWPTGLHSRFGVDNETELRSVLVDGIEQALRERDDAQRVSRELYEMIHA